MLKNVNHPLSFRQVVITDRITITNTTKEFKIWGDYQKVTRKQEVGKCWENGAGGLAQCQVATNPEFVRNAISAEHNTAKHNKMRNAYINVFYLHNSSVT